MRTTLPLLSALLLPVFACAGSEPSDIRPIGPAEDTRDTTEIDAPEDADEPSDAAPETGPEDTRPPDTEPVPDATNDGDTADDVEDDLPTFVCEVTADECDPSTVRCADDSTRVFCDRCGFVINTSECAVNEVCDDSAGSAVCIPCEGDACEVINDCVPNTRTCRDFRTAQVCGPDGTVTATNPCPAGRRCFDGNCGPEGGETSASCSVNLSPTEGCRGTLCVCGEEWIAASTDAGCRGTLDDGYCSTSGCIANGCDPASEICADFSVNGTWAGSDFCITREGCTRTGTSCGAPGMVCQELPTRASASDRIEWGLACWTAGSRAIGQTCDSNQDCSGGLCLTRSRGGVPVSYCAATCGAEAGCPSNAQCVRDPRDDGRFLCLANATAADCPRLDTEPLNIRPSRELARWGGGTARVCYFGFE